MQLSDEFPRATFLKEINAGREWRVDDLTINVLQSPSGSGAYSASVSGVRGFLTADNMHGLIEKVRRNSTYLFAADKISKLNMQLNEKNSDPELQFEVTKLTWTGLHSWTCELTLGGYPAGVIQANESTRNGGFVLETDGERKAFDTIEHIALELNGGCDDF